MKPRNILQQLTEEVKAGKTSLAAAALELYRAGWFTYIPTASQTKAFLAYFGNKSNYNFGL